MSNADADTVDLKRLKEVVSKLLPPSSALRGLVLAENDQLPLPQALAKFEIFDRLLLRELGR